MVFSTHYSIFSLSNLTTKKKKEKENKKKNKVVCAQCLNIFPSYFSVGSNSAPPLSIPWELLLLNLPVSSMSLNLMEVSKSHYLHDSVAFGTADYSLLSEILSTLDLHDTTFPNFVPVSLLFIGLIIGLSFWTLPLSVSNYQGPLLDSFHSVSFHLWNTRHFYDFSCHLNAVFLELSHCFWFQDSHIQPSVWHLDSSQPSPI